MSLLHADDGARFCAITAPVGERTRASYVVIVKMGPETKTQSDVRTFPTYEDALAWLSREAAFRGFKEIQLERR